MLHVNEYMPLLSYGVGFAGGGWFSKLGDCVVALEGNLDVGILE